MLFSPPLKTMKCCSLNKDSLLVIKILPFVLLIGVCDGVQSKQIGKLNIKKCCPKGQLLNSALMCINATRDLEDDKRNNTGRNAGKELSYSPGNPSKNSKNPHKELLNNKLLANLDWFPFPSVINSSSLEEITNFESLSELFSRSAFEYGKRPDCHSDEKDWACFNQNNAKQFHLLLYPEKEIRLYVSKISSFHRGEHFKVENRDCGYLKIDPEENNADRKEKGGDLVMESLFKFNELRTFPLSDVCTDKGPNGTFFVEFCPCNTVPCVRKCCGKYEIFDEAQGKCAPSSNFKNWRPTLKNSSLTENYYLLVKRYPSTCKRPRLLKSGSFLHQDQQQHCRSFQFEEDRNGFHFLPDGSLQVKKYKESISAQSYCGDYVMYNSSVFSENNLLLCLQEENFFSKFHVYGIFFIIGGVVLLVTISISLYLPELRTSVYSKVIICHNASLMIADFVWGLSYLLPFVTYNLCVVLSLTIQFTFLGSFFWMNVMCLDISIGIRRLEFISGRNPSDRQRFLAYLVYACGTPAIITSVTAAMEFVPSLPSQLVRPGFGCRNCGFNPDSSAILIYVYGPMLAIILLNIIFYLVTIYQIIQISRETKILICGNSSTQSVNRGKKRLIIFSKLFLLMGLSWIMEIVGWAAGGNEYYWYLPDMINISRAVFIFVIFIWKRKILESLVRKWRKKNGGNWDSSAEKVSVTKNVISEVDLLEIKRREKILRKQITQTLRNSDESTF